MARRGTWLSTVIFFLAVIVIWQLVTTYGRINPFLLPSFDSVVRRIAADFTSGKLATDTAASVYRALAAFALATVAGILVGLAMAASRQVRWFMVPLVSFGLPLPKVAMLPVFMIWFGLFDLSKVTLAAFSAVFVVIAATFNGATKVDHKLIWSARNLGASRWHVISDVVFPGALSGIYTGLQVAFPICLVVTFVAEMVMGGQGLGGTMLMNARYVDSPGVFAGIIEIAIVGNFLVAVMQYLRAKILFWMPNADHPS
jgi:taurine transport system permease protein